MVHWSKPERCPNTRLPIRDTGKSFTHSIISINTEDQSHGLETCTHLGSTCTTHGPKMRIIVVHWPCVDRGGVGHVGSDPAWAGPDSDMRIGVDQGTFSQSVLKACCISAFVSLDKFTTIYI